MIEFMEGMPANMVGFKATGEITEADFSETVMPKVKELVSETHALNYLLVLDTSIKNFTMGAWMKDALMGLQNLTKWNRAAIVTDVDAIRIFTDLFSIVVPGEFKGFEQNELQVAIDWVAGGESEK